MIIDEAIEKITIEKDHIMEIMIEISFIMIFSIMNHQEKDIEIVGIEIIDIDMKDIENQEIMPI